MALRHIPVGSTITRTYFWVPIGYAVGQSFPTWDEACEYAQARLTKPGAGYSHNVNLRWVMKEPDGLETDIVVETYSVMRHH